MPDTLTCRLRAIVAVHPPDDTEAPATSSAPPTEPDIARWGWWAFIRPDQDKAATPPERPATADRPALMDRVKRRVDELLAALDASATILTVSLFVVCVVLVLSFVPWQQNSDDLLPAIISLQRLTLYYWEQNRFGNLLPALTAWISDPTGNAYAQIVLRVVAGMVAPVFFTAMMFRRASDVWRAALATDCLILLAGSQSLLHEAFIVATPYGTSLACAGLAILALRRAWQNPAGWRRSGLTAFGIAALVAAHIVNYGLALVAIPMLGLLAVLLPSAERMRLLVVTCGAALFAALLPAAAAPQYPTSLALALSLPAMGRFMTEIAICAGWGFVLAVGLPLGLHWVAARHGRVRRSPEPFVRLALAACVTTALVFLLAASSEHVMLNSYNARYFVPVFWLLLSLAGVAAWQSLRQIAPTRMVRDALFVMLALVLLMSARGRLAASGEVTTDIIGWDKSQLARGVGARSVTMTLDGIAGTYWDTWPSVFAAAQLHHDAGWTGADVLGIAKRGASRRDVFVARLMAKGRLRVGCIDLTPKACLDLTMDVMGVPGLRVQTFATADPIGDGHVLSYAEITPAR